MTWREIPARPYLAGLTFVYRRPMSEVDPAAAPAAVSGPSMENLRALCAATDAETRCAIALAGGTLVEMAADRGRACLIFHIARHVIDTHFASS